jgi:hypothetical protein
MPRPIPVIAIAALAALELALVGFAVGTSDVSENYRAYYIERTTGCIDRPAIGSYRLGETLSLSQHEDSAFAKVLACGFGYGQRGGTWLQGNLAKLQFTDPPPSGPLVFEFKATPELYDDQPTQQLTLLANGMTVATIDMSAPAAAVHRIEIGAEITALSQDGLELRFELADTRIDRTRPPDGQRHTLFINWIRLTRN